MLEFGRAALYNNSFVLDSACRVQREVIKLHFASCITQCALIFNLAVFFPAAAQKACQEAHGPAVPAIHCGHQPPYQKGV